MRFPLLVGLGLALVLGLGCADEKSTVKDKVGKEPAGKGEKNPVVVMKTSLGTIKIELFPNSAPLTVKNFLGYVDSKFYDGTVFHRVIPDFMIQGGGFEKGVSNAHNDAEFLAKEKETRAPIKNESPNGLSNERGTIAMARTDDPDSATAQFFINVEHKPHLDRGRYCVFGKVIEGMDVVDKIRDVPTMAVSRNFQNVPQEDVVIESVRRADK
jgi:cyclophilin family peptidyl-prolyl cis-trans isomerase